MGTPLDAFYEESIMANFFQCGFCKTKKPKSDKVECFSCQEEMCRECGVKGMDEGIMCATCYDRYEDELLNG